MGIVTYAQNFEDVLLWRALGDVTPGFYIDVGAWDPDADSVTRAFSEHGWRGINIEPVTQYWIRLVARRPRDVNLPVALGNAQGTRTLYEVAGAGLSTLVPAHAAGSTAQALGVSEHTVKVVTLAQVCELHAPDHIHFLKIDCEGSEKAVLEGADFTRFRPWIVVVEATAPLTDQPVHAQWENLLTEASYRFVWFDGLNRFYVAFEHHERLAPRLALPANVFDGFRYPPVKLTPPPPVSHDPLAAAMPGMLDDAARIALAARCRDCDDLPGSADAGRVMLQDDGTRVQIMHNGLKMEAHTADAAWVTELIARCHGHHEPQKERVFDGIMKVLKADSTMIDLGSSWAYYACWFLVDQPRRRAVLVEPDPKSRSLAKRNLTLNGLRARVLAGVAGAGPRAPTDTATKHSGLQSLPRYSVPQIMAKQRIDFLDLLHCDAQGAELGILAGCGELFDAGRIGWVVVSTHVHQISRDYLTHERCLQLLRNAGASVEVEHTPYESFSGDGRIVARFGSAPQGWAPPRISRARACETLFRAPIFDLAEAGLLADRLSQYVENMVQGAYRTILLREAEQAAMDIYGRPLLATGDAHTFLLALLRSEEFAGKLDAFVAQHVARDIENLAGS